jgi:quercetin dioxygenase-like cupin family protein
MLNHSIVAPGGESCFGIGCAKCKLPARKLICIYVVYLFAGVTAGCRCERHVAPPTSQPLTSAPDLVTADPTHATLVFENDRVRVVRLRLPPHEKTPFHSHPDRVVVYLTNLKVRITLPDGTSEDSTVSAGAASWSNAVIHAGENISDKPWEIVEVELKDITQPPSIPIDVTEKSAPDLVTADPKHATLVFENSRVRVVRLRLPPHEKTPMHSHPDRVVVYLTDVRVRITLQDGTTGDADVKAGTASWSQAVVHAGENISDQPWEIVEVELKSQPTQPSRPPS